MTEQLTPERLAELQRLARGERNPTQNGTPTNASTNGHGRATPATTRSVDHLLSQALRSENGRTRALAEKIHTLAVNLAHRVHDEYQTRRQRLDTEITTLEHQLAEARARRHSLDQDATPRTIQTSPTASALVRRAGARSEVDAAAVRAWAADNGYQVKPIGRIPTDVITAWQKASHGSNYV